jgi:hypothetical protein
VREESADGFLAELNAGVRAPFDHALSAALGGTIFYPGRLCPDTGRAPAATLGGELTPLQRPAVPVVVKAPTLPVLVCPPPAGSQGARELACRDDGATALFRASDRSELGFALAGGRCRGSQALARRMPALLSRA